MSVQEDVEWRVHVQITYSGLHESIQLNSSWTILRSINVGSPSAV